MSNTHHRLSPGSDVFAVLESRRAPRCLFFSDADAGLRAILVIDDWTLGPAAGGIRTRVYTSLDQAVDEAARLARAMTIKNALAGLDAGGGKMVVMDHPGLRREAAFLRLGELVEELGGRFSTGADLGTTVADLEIMARRCGHVHVNLPHLANAVARGLVRCIEACVRVAGKPGLAGLRVAVQGCGEVGSAVARALARAGADIVVADIDEARAHALCVEVGARKVAVHDLLTSDVDIVCPCAVGGVITTEVARAMRAWALCGAANLVMASPEASLCVHERGILHVPDVVASAGAVAEGLGQTLMHLADRTPLIDALGTTAAELLVESKRTGRPTDELAEARARARIRGKQAQSS